MNKTAESRKQAATREWLSGPTNPRRQPVDLGVLGGMGPQATHYFVGELLNAVELQHRPRRDQDYPNIIVRYSCSLPDRTTALETDLEPFAKVLTQEVESLLELGCPQIVVPCITAHAVIETRMSKWPVVNIPRVVAGHLQREKPQARVGVLATRGAHLAGVTDKFSDNGQGVVTLEPSEEAELMSFIYQKLKTWQGQKHFAGILEFVDLLRRRGCDVVVAGCTELEMCCVRCGTDRPDLIFPLRVVAQDFAAKWKHR
jgi:aspartate racemase